jgi:hypothetical protein
MSEKTPSPNEIVKKQIVYQVPGMDAVAVRRDIEYQPGLALDLYSPPGLEAGERRPAVVFVTGYPDPGFVARLGSRLKDMGQYTSWGRLLAASGLIAVTYSNREPGDLYALLRYLRENAAALGIDAERLGLWAGSGNVPMALSALMQEPPGSFRCAVLCYGFMLDLGGATHVAEAAAQIGFANPCAGRAVGDLPPGLPLFIARAGRDQMPRLNDSIDRFAAEALAKNLPLTLANHAAAAHAFDLFEDSAASREVIRQEVAFLAFHLLG